MSPLRARAWLRLPGLVALLAAAGLLAAAPGRALADCPLPQAPAAALAAAPVVFVGTVTAVADNAQTATVDVDEIWKGPNVADPTTVYGGGVGTAGSAAEGRSWVVGTRYLFFPQVDPDGNLVDSDCSSTAVYSAAFDPLRPAGAHAPQGPPTSGVRGDPPIAAVFVLIVLLGTAGGLLLWRTGRVESPA